MDVDVFLKGGGALDINSVRKKPKDWIPDNVWLSIIALSFMDAFRDIPDSVFRNDGLWRQWYDQEAPEVSKVPDYEDRLSKFERMCVVKTFREDRTLIAAADYIADALGQRFVESVPLNMEHAWLESHNKVRACVRAHVWHAAMCPDAARLHHWPRRLCAAARQKRFVTLCRATNNKDRPQNCGEALCHRECLVVHALPLMHTYHTVVH